MLEVTGPSYTLIECVGMGAILCHVVDPNRHTHSLIELGYSRPVYLQLPNGISPYNVLSMK